MQREDLSLLLTILGEVDLLSRSSREHLFVRANHTYPLGMISMDGETVAAPRVATAVACYTAGD